MDAPATNRELGALFEQTLEPIIRQALEAFGLAGLAVGIVKDGRLAYSRGFGVRSIETQEPVTPESLFHMASVSKPFVATAIMQLVETRQVQLDAPVVTYLPYFRLADERAREMTILQLLSHISGMPDEMDYEWYKPEDDEGALERYVRSLSDSRLIGAPGQRLAYSNIAYEVLGDVIAKVSGLTFEAYLQQHVLDPLGMTHSTFLRRDVSPDLATAPHVGAPLAFVPGGYPYHRAHAPSSTLHSSVVDMSRWAVANLNRGELDGRRILQAESYDLLWHPHAPSGQTGWGEACGLSWWLGSYRDRRLIYHDGADPGFETSFVLVPDAEAAVVILGNANTSVVDELMEVALDALFGLDPQPLTPPALSVVAPVLAAEGIVAAAESYRHLQATQPDAYRYDDGQFFRGSWGAVDLRETGRILPQLRLGIELHPQSFDLHTLLAQAYLQTGENEHARTHLEQALALEPDDTFATKLMEQLDAQ